MSRKLHQRRLMDRYAAMRNHATRVIAGIIVFMLSATPAHAAPLIVNTEAFQTIDAGDAATDVELRFGASNETVQWDIEKGQFNISDDVHIENNLTASGGLAIEENIRAKGDITLNSDNAAANATLTFGNFTLPQTISFIDATQKFKVSTSLDVVGTMSGYALTVSGLRNCNTIDTNADGELECGTDEGGEGSGLSQADGDARYVNLSGDTMTGSLSVRGTLSGSVIRAGNMTVSGAIVYSSGSQLMQNAKGLSGQLLIAQGTAAPKWATPTGGMMWYFDEVQEVTLSKGAQITMPFGMTFSSISMRAKGAPTGAAYIIDINNNGASIFGTRPQINASATTGGGSAVFSTTAVPAGAVITLDVDQVGSTFAGSGITIMLTGTRSY